MNQDEQPATSQGDFFNSLNDKVDAHGALVDRFHVDLQTLSKQIAGCDKLVRMAHISLNQIDARIAEAVRIETQAAVQLEATGREAARAATEAASAAVAGMIGQMQAASREAEQVCGALHRARGQTGLWLAAYVAGTLAMCLLSAWIAYQVHPDTPVPPEVAGLAELGKKHEALLDKASDKELKLLKEIQARRARPK
ncbi:MULTISPECIES: hypothetical protein [unclassified Duganella]|uniref:hypothetical protein n=1 Tax=unclassified Duganella TaxID=2636909 RepID=UPI000E343BB9|nr:MULTISPECIES: hypothetical protein [unclassified Duganella]RFP08195.1 hypothetical protein D0T23_29785 [Duganella sp. BJB475]RFP22483.1 hypothetical protein D0T21_30990 [Duganella sp. BJB476]